MLIVREMFCLKNRFLINLDYPLTGETERQATTSRALSLGELQQRSPSG